MKEGDDQRPERPMPSRRPCPYPAGLIADKVEADALYAKLAEFVVANITTANMINANIVGRY